MNMKVEIPKYHIHVMPLKQEVCVASHRNVPVTALLLTSVRQRFHSASDSLGRELVNYTTVGLARLRGSPFLESVFGTCTKQSVW